MDGVARHLDDVLAGALHLFPVVEAEALTLRTRRIAVLHETRALLRRELATRLALRTTLEHFELSAEVIRLGSRVASTRMEFRGADGKLLSTGAAAYIVS